MQFPVNSSAPVTTTSPRPKGKSRPQMVRTVQVSEMP